MTKIMHRFILGSIDFGMGIIGQVNGYNVVNNDHYTSKPMTEEKIVLVFTN